MWLISEGNNLYPDTFRKRTESLAIQWIGYVGAFVVGVIVSVTNVPEAHAARYVKVVISVDGQPTLESSRGDRGSEDVDEVWGI